MPSDLPCESCISQNDDAPLPLQLSKCLMKDTQWHLLLSRAGYRVCCVQGVQRLRVLVGLVLKFQSS